jgi:hypothetical protein
VRKKMVGSGYLLVLAEARVGFPPRFLRLHDSRRVASTEYPRCQWLLQNGIIIG